MARRRITHGLPQPNQIDDLKRHMELGRKAEDAARRGNELVAAGNDAGARKALEEAEEAMAERATIEQRWRIQYPAS